MYKRQIWGSDHHGYLPRIIASIKALKLKSEKLKTFFIQFVSLVKKGQKTSMSTRAGDFVTLNELIEELPQNQYEVLKMRLYQDMSFKEISERTNVSINTSLGRMRYGLINLRKIIKERNLSMIQ